MRARTLAVGVGVAAVSLPAGVAPAGTPCPWDCGDDDGNVGIVDLLELLIQWGRTGTSCDIDGTGVGIVQFLDLLVHWGPCPAGPCDGAGGDCCISNGTPGCADTACCELVCDLDPFCCDVVWDLKCAGAAGSLCDCGGGGGDCGDAQAGDCCIANGSPACDDFLCCDAVCAIDPFCCDVEWDAMCVSLAEQICAICF